MEWEKKTQQQLHLQAVKMPVSSVPVSKKYGKEYDFVMQDRLTASPCELQSRLEQLVNVRTTVGKNRWKVMLFSFLCNKNWPFPILFQEKENPYQNIFSINL